MEYESNHWMWDGAFYNPHLFGGLMVTAALLGLSTSYFGRIGVPYFPYLLPNFGILKKRKREKKRIRVYMDGCFDLMHYGHANALRQAKALGNELVVGVVSDEEILANKGPPVLSMEERLALVSGLKWVDEVIANAPYAITEPFMKKLFNKYMIDYIIHGDDPCLLPDGTDAYALAKKAGRYKQIKRTEGVSSTNILGKILSAFKSTTVHEANNNPILHDKTSDLEPINVNKQHISGHISHFLPTSRRIVQFSNGKIDPLDFMFASEKRPSPIWGAKISLQRSELPLEKFAPGPNARVVYIDGAFDLFHAGHVEILKAARQLGDFLLVGIYTDETLSNVRGAQFPLMNLHERSLNVLSCRYVDEIIIGAPWEVTKDMIMTFNIALVVHGTVAESSPLCDGKADPYAVPKSMGIFKILESPKSTTTTSSSKNHGKSRRVHEAQP